MHPANATFRWSINFVHNRTKHCSNCVCIRSVWHHTGKQCWTTHFHFTEQENRASVMLAGEDKSATPWEPLLDCKCYHSCTYQKSILWLITTLKRLLAGRTIVIIFIHLETWIHTHHFCSCYWQQSFYGLTAEKWVVKTRVILQVRVKHLNYSAYVTTSIKHGSNRRSGNL